MNRLHKIAYIGDEEFSRISTAFFVSKHIIDIERKYPFYFRDKNIRINDLVRIEWTLPFSIHVVNRNLPTEIIFDIESMFWVD